jgi:hypothetical protein
LDYRDLESPEILPQKLPLQTQSLRRAKEARCLLPTAYCLLIFQGGCLGGQRRLSRELKIPFSCTLSAKVSASQGELRIASPAGFAV